MDGDVDTGLNSLGSREQAAVHSIDNGLCSDQVAAEESSIQTLDGVLSALDAVELQVNVALGIGI